MRILVITHYYAQGPAQELVKFLRRKKNSVDLISHPFPYCKDTRSWMESTSPEGMTAVQYFRAWRGPSLWFYIKDAFLNLFWGRKTRVPYDLVVSCDCLNTTTALILRRLGITKKVIYYSIDYADKRFKSSLLNKLYHLLDRLSASRSDCVWNLSSKMHERRVQLHGEKSLAASLIVPTGANFESITRAPEERANPCRLGYMGHLRKYQGVELAIDVLAELAPEFPELTLDILGDGPLLSNLQARVKQLNLNDRVRFHGFIGSHEELERKLTGMGVGLALYEPRPESFSYYADPNKPKIYMACGLPVITTSVPASSREIEESGAGLVVNYELITVTETIRRWLVNRHDYLQARNRAIQFAECRSWTNTFTQALQSTLQPWEITSAEMQPIKEHLRSQQSHFDREYSRHGVLTEMPNDFSFYRRAVHHLNLRKNSRFLDIGCGARAWQIRAANRDGCFTAGCDVSFRGLKRASALIKDEGGVPRCVVCDAQHLPFKLNSFDAVLSLSVIEHVTRDDWMAKEISRTLTPGSKAYLVTPLAYWMMPILLWIPYWRHDRHIGHLRHYSPSRLAAIFRESGMQNVSWFTTGHFFKIFQLLPKLPAKLWWFIERLDLSLHWYPRGLQLNSVFKKSMATDPDVAKGP